MPCLEDPQAPTHPHDHAVLWFLTVQSGLQSGSQRRRAGPGIPGVGVWLNLELPSEAVSACHRLHQHWLLGLVWP